MSGSDKIMNKMSLAILRQLMDDKKDFVFSPISLRTVLDKLKDEAVPQFQESLTSWFPNPSPKLSPLLSREEWPINTESKFAYRLSNSFRRIISESKLLNLAEKGSVDELIPSRDEEVYQFENIFSIRDSLKIDFTLEREEKFTRFNGQSQLVKMLIAVNQVIPYYYDRKNNLHIICLNYGFSVIAFFVMSSKAGKNIKIIANLKQDKFVKMLCETVPLLKSLMSSDEGIKSPKLDKNLTHINQLGLPRFVVSSRFDLNEIDEMPLSKIKSFGFDGITRIFTFESANHSVNFSFMESVKSESTTRNQAKASVKLPVIKELIFNKPFMFLVYDTQRCEMLFTGCVFESKLIT